MPTPTPTNTPAPASPTKLAYIDRDYLYERDQREGVPNEEGTASSRVGDFWTQRHLPEPFESYEWDGCTPRIVGEYYKTRFRLKDDDGEIYYGGWLINDPQCIMQQILLAWGGYDAGCTTIEVKINKTITSKWTQEIG